MALVDEIKAQENTGGQETALQRPSLLVQHISQHGAEGLNQGYVNYALANGGGFGATAAGVVKDTEGNLHPIYDFNRSKEEIAYAKALRRGENLDTWYAKAKDESDAAAENYKKLSDKLASLNAASDRALTASPFAVATYQNAPSKEEISHLEEAVKQAEKDQQRKSDDFAAAKAYKDYRDTTRPVEEAYERGISYSDINKSYEQSLDKLNKDRATLIKELDSIRHGGRYIGDNPEEQSARQEADEENALARLEALERQIERVSGLQRYAQSRITSDVGAEAVIRQGEELARTAREQGVETADANRKVKNVADHLPNGAAGYTNFRNWVGLLSYLPEDGSWLASAAKAVGEAVRDLPEAYNPISFIAELGIRSGEDAQHQPQDNWTKEQVDLYNYFYGSKDYGPDVAKKYAQQLNYAINSGDVDNQTAAQYKEGLNAGGSFGSKAARTIGGLVGAIPDMALAAGDFQNKALDIIATGDYAGHREATAHDKFSAFNRGRVEDLNRNTLSENIPVIGGKGWGDLYQLGQSSLQSLAMGNVLGEAATLGAFFVNAANSSFDEAMQRSGGNTEYASTVGLLSGAAEVLSEMLPLDHLLKGGKVGSLSYILKQQGLEGIGEGSSSLMNLFFDHVAAKLTGEQSAVQQRISNLVRQGMSYEDAEKKVWRDTASDVAFDVAGGTISGGFSAAAQSVQNSLYNYTQNRNSRNQQNQQTAQPAQPTQAEASQRPTTRNPLYEALNPQTPAAETATVAENATTEEPAPATQPVAETPQAPTAETTTPTVEAATQPQATEATDASQETAAEPEPAATAEPENRFQATPEAIARAQNLPDDVRESLLAEFAAAQQDLQNNPELANDADFLQRLNDIFTRANQAINEANATASAESAPTAEPAPAPAPATTTPTGTGTEQSAVTIPASEQTTAERTNGMGNERERNMSRNLRNNEKADPGLRNSFEQNRDLYTQLTNAEVAAKAAEIVGKGYEAAKNDIYEKIGQAKAGAKLAPEYAVAGYQLANEMAQRGELEAARELGADIAAELSFGGQLGQIGRLILESDPYIRIKTVDKIVDKINDSMTDRQKAKNKKRSGGKESARKANEAAQAAQKQAADMVANALSGGDTFNFPDAAAKEVAGSIKAQIKRSLSPQKPRNALDTFVGYVKKFAREKINVGEKSKPMTSTELLREVVNNEELFMEVYEKAQAEFMGEDATGYREFVEDYVNTPVGIDGTGDARNKLFMQAIVESATATSENAQTIRTQAALGVPHGEIANRIADALINETGATGGIADSIRGSAQAYVNEIINSDEKTGDARAEREVTSIMQAIGVKFREMAVQNKAAKDAVRRDIANMLATEYALSPDSAEKIAQSVANEYDRQLSDAMAKEVEKRFAPKEKRAKAEAKALTQQLTEAINLGTFSSDYATEAVNKIFGVDGNVSVSDEALKRYADAKTKEEQNEALDAIEQEIADQIPATFRDKFTALRYLNMLGNLKTQDRNIVGNAAMAVATNAKYLTQHIIELGYAAARGGEYQMNTALNTSKELRQQAAADFEANIDEIKGETKYADVSRQAAKGIQDKRTIFGSGESSKWASELASKALKRDVDVKKNVLENARKVTNWAMDAGDEIFLRQVYVRSFAGWMKAHGVTDVNSASPEQVSAAREFAKKEAQEATFHDSNQFSEFVTSIDANWDKGHSKKVNEIGAAAKMITQGIMPFRRTTANVAVRAVEYSPVGFAMSAIQAARGADAAQTINNLAKSVTGTVLFRAGMLLAAAGRARASGDDEDKKLNNFQKLQGAMDYSVKVGDKYISLSQLAPMAIPFFMGVKLNELLEYSDNLFSADSIGDILGVVSEPMLEMSMLSGVNDFLNDLSSVSGDTDALPSLIGNAALSYLSQGLTNSLLGQLEQASERNRQTTYSDTKSADATGFDRFLGKNQYKIGKYSAKIPGIDYNQQDYVDAWGRTQSNGGAGERAFNAFLNPTYTGKDRSTDVDEELERLYRDNRGKDDFPDVFPQKRSRSDAIGDGVVMTPDEYLAFSKESGQKKLELVREFIQSSDYKNLTDEQRAETIHNLYAFADATALQKVRDANGVTVENKYAKISDLSNVPAYLAATERFKAEAAKEGKEFNGWTNTNFEKYVSAGLKAEDLDVLAESALSDARKPVYDLMREVGMSPKEYMDAIAVMDGEKHDGQFKQADVYNWLTKNTTMSTEQKNQLWDMLGNNWKTSFSNYKPK